MELLDDAYKLGLLTLFSYLTAERFAWQDDNTETALERDGPFGYGGRVSLEKTSGEYWVGGVNALYFSSNLALNDTGFLDRPDRLFISPWLTHHRKKPLGPLVRYGVKLSGWIDRNTDWVDLGDGFSIDSTADLVNGWYVGSWFFCGWPLCDDRETRTGGEVALCGQDQRYRFGVWAYSPEKHPVSFGVDAAIHSKEHGTYGRLLAQVKFNLHHRFQLEILPGYSRATGDLRWLDTVETAEGDRFLFGDQHHEYWDVTLRGTYAFTTRLTMQAYAQVLLAAVDHTAKYALVPDGREIHVADLVRVTDVPDDYDATSANINLNAILRWEVLPGSVVYLVYSGSSGESLELPDFRFGEKLGDLLDSDARHVLMLKVSFFMG